MTPPDRSRPAIEALLAEVRAEGWQPAKRSGYTRIPFTERELFLAAVAEYHRTRREAR